MEERIALIRIPKWLADLSLKVNRLYYKQLLQYRYGARQRGPAWFDHRIDLYFHWPHNLFWLERGIFPRKEMFEGCAVLDLFCGDGFYSRYFYSTIAGTIDAIDKDPLAIKHAKYWHCHPKINYIVADLVKEELPGSHYDVIVWFEGIEHLSESEYAVVIERIKSVMGETSVLIGSTPLVSSECLEHGNWEHKNEFASVEPLKKFLCHDFTDIQIDVTDYPVLGGGQRRTAYFTLRHP